MVHKPGGRKLGLYRQFRAETGQTPARFVEEVRLDAARRRLEEGAEGIERIAHDCGFGSAERMRRSFLRRLGVNPNDYRRRFRGPAQTQGEPA